MLVVAREYLVSDKRFLIELMLAHRPGSNLGALFSSVMIAADLSL